MSGQFSLSFYDTASSAACPAGAPARAVCFSLTGTASDARFGTVTMGPTMDPEVRAASRACGKPAVYTARVRAAGGTLTVTEKGPRLCLDSTTAEPRHFTVVSGTGEYEHAAGAGTISMIPGSSGATEQWTGHVTLR